ncbi:MAG: glycosyltransferase family 4 protein [Patescibacteria group bacterium]
MNKPIKILIATPLYPPDIGGPATYSKKLVEELPKHDIDVDILSFGEVKHLPKIIRHIVYFFYVLRRGKNIDIIYAQDPVSVGLPSALASFFLRKKFLLKIVGDYAWEQGMQRFGVEDLLDEFLAKKYNFRVETLRTIERFVARRAVRIVVPSEYLKTVVVRLGIDAQKVTVIYNDVALPKMIMTHDDARSQLGWKPNEVVFVSIGRLVPWKGFVVLIKSMKNILAQYPHAKLFIIGNGPQYGYLRDTIYAAGLENNVYLLGVLTHDAVIKYLVAADVFLLNTGYEGFSHQLLEAFAVGTPTITTDAGGNREIVKENGNALVADYNYQKAWVDMMLSVCADKDLRKRLSTESRLNVAKYQQNRMIEKTASFLKSL